MTTITKKSALLLCLLVALIVLSCSSSKDYGTVLVDEEIVEAGSYDLIWDLTYENGARVTEGLYELIYITDNFEASLLIQVTTPSGLDAYEKELPSGIFLKPIPDAYGLSVDHSKVHSGQSLTITYDLPQSDRVYITFSRIFVDINPL